MIALEYSHHLSSSTLTFGSSPITTQPLTGLFFKILAKQLTFLNRCGLLRLNRVVRNTSGFTKEEDVSDDYKKLLERSISIVEAFLKGRISLKISYGLIASGVSILGFGNFVPYLVLLIRPELKNTVETQNNLLTIIALFLIVVGALLPVFVQVFNYYKSIYIKDIEKMNTFFSFYNIDSFHDDMQHISSTMSIFDYQQDRIEDAYRMLLKSDFSFSNQKINKLIKQLGDNLSAFDSKLGLRTHPAGGHSSIPVEQRTTEVIDDIVNDCKTLSRIFNELHSEFTNLQSKNFMRFFV